MLFAHAKAGQAGLTAGEIAAAGGYTTYSTANAVYGKLGRNFVWVMHPELRAVILGEGKG